MRLHAQPSPIQYRKSRGLFDYNEHMVLLIQVVGGQADSHYYCPQLAGQISATL
ncbi:MAG TPA: hypothetical protein PKK82_04450 [Anaerolineaceae bacterium]|nr:hypothetical protein [Anaerolineaceae bacterium]